MNFSLSTTRLESQNPYSLDVLQKEWDRFAARYMELSKALDASYKKRENNRRSVRGDKSVKFDAKANAFNYQQAHEEYTALDKYLGAIRIQANTNYNRIWFQFPK